MSVARRARATARRFVLTGMRWGYRLSGRLDEAESQPGVTVLLLHNTLPGQLESLLSFIDRRPGLVVDFAHAMDLLDAGKAAHPMVALTFDDGFQSNLRAADALRARGVGACFYIPTGVVGMDRPSVDAFFGRPQAEGVMTWDDLEHLRDTGHEVGSHCRRHLPLSAMPLAQAEDEVKGSVETLRQRLGLAAHFAWPFGSLAHAPVDAVRRWCSEIGVLPASGVRGRNTSGLMQRRGYLSRDAVDLRRIASDYDVFVTRHSGIGTSGGAG